MAYEKLSLSFQLCFRIYALERELMAAYRPLLNELGLTYPQYITMLYLWEHEKGTVGELCSALNLDTGTMSPLLKRLENSGLITRRRLPEDERTVEVRLTEVGRALEERALSVPDSIATCLLTGDTDEQERRYDELKRILDQALDQLRSSRKKRKAALN